MRVKVLPGRADASAQAPPTPTPGAALRQRWTPSADPAANLAALRADLEIVVPGLAASVRTGLLAKDLARPAAERGPLNRVLCAMEHLYCAGNAGFLWTPTSDDEGIHSVVVQVADPFGLTDDVEVLLSVVLDAAPPTPILVADVNPACTGDPVRVCAGAVDNVGVARLELRVDGRPAALDDARCVTELRVDPGAVVFDLDVWDPSGNTAHQVLYVDWRSCGGVP